MTSVSGVLYETDGSGAITALYTYSDDGRLVSMTKVGQGTYYYHYNAHGDVVQMTDATGNVVADYTYDAWGNIVNSTGSFANSNPYRCAGYRYDSETGMYYLMARYYKPDIGRFISKDPDPGDSDDPVTQNGYTYANNNPIMNVDPDGHWAWLVVNLAFAAYDAYQAYRSGDSWGGVAASAALGFVGGSRLKTANLVRPVAEKAVKSFFKKAGSKAIDHQVRTYKNGWTKAAYTIPSRVGGQARATYVKLINPEGKTKRLYKDTYKKDGRFWHRKFKLGGPSGERY